MKIEIFGPGCARCEALAERTRAAADKLGIDYELVQVKNFDVMSKRGVLMTPALAVNGVIKCMGRVPAEDEIAGHLKEAVAAG